MKKFTILLLTIIIGCVVKPNAQKTKPTVYPTNTALSSSSNSIPTEVLVSSVVTPNVITSTIALAQSSSLVISPSPASQSSIPTRIEDIYAEYPYPPPDELKFNDGRNKESYGGKILVVIDSYLMRNAISESKERDRYPRKVMVLKESYDELTDIEKADLKREYPDYTIFDRNTPLKGEVIYDGGLSNATSWIFNNKKLALVFSRCFYDLNNPNLDKNLYSNIFQKRTEQNDIDFPFDSIYSKDIFNLYQNLKKLNREMIMRKSIKKILVGSIKDLSLFSTFLKANVEYRSLFLRFYFPNLYWYSSDSAEYSNEKKYGLYDLEQDKLTTEIWRRTELNTSNYNSFLSEIFY